MRFDNVHELEPELERECYANLDRYLQHLSRAELEARYLAIWRHLRLAEIAAAADPTLRLLPLGDFRGIQFWLRKELLTAEEFRMRQLSLPQASRSVCAHQTPRPSSLDRKRAGGDDFLVRYAKFGFINDMLEDGAIRIKQASSYKQIEVGEARFDDELSKHDFALGDRVTITNPRTNGAIPVIGNLRYTQTAPDYYVLCVSNDFDGSLFASFRCDACLIIHQPAEFAKRLQVAASNQFPGWHFNHFNIEYYDPYELEPSQRVNVVRSKNFIFAYQREYRFFWFPPKGQRIENHIDLKIGELKGIAEIVRALQPNVTDATAS